jgi:hypothetical protein
VPRFLPPHLMVLVALLLIVVWVILLHQFRRSAALQSFVAEVFGDETPATALRTFETARQRLESHLHSHELDHQMRQRIELALGSPGDTPGSDEGNHEV